MDELLLGWFRENGRDLPWRRTRDPYAILVSEVMLQQTQVGGVGRYTADAVAAFALGEPVLPADTNVHRVQERTGHAFGPECGQALMDLGSTICLARVPRCGVCPLARRCPSRGRRYEPLRKQGRFEGSFRQRRAHVLRAVAERPRRLGQLDGDAVDALVRDGLVHVRSGIVSLPSSD